MVFVEIDDVRLAFASREMAVAAGFEKQIMNLEEIADGFYRAYFVRNWDYNLQADKELEEVYQFCLEYATNPYMVYEDMKKEYPVFGEGNTRKLADEVKRIFEEKYMKNAQTIVVRIPRSG